MKNLMNKLMIVFIVLTMTACSALKEKNSVGPETVEEVTITGFEINPKPVDVQPGKEIRVKALITYSDGTTEKVTSETNWDIDDRSTATVDADGNVSGMKNGQTTLRARYGNHRDECQVKVNGPVPGMGSLSFKIHASEEVSITVVSFEGDTVAIGYASGSHVSNLNPGNYWVWAYAKDHEPDFERATVVADIDVHVEFSLMYADPSTVSLAGTIRPVNANASVIIVSASGKVINTRSPFAVSNLEPDIYWVIGSAEGYESYISNPIIATTPGLPYAIGMDLIVSDPTTGSISGTIFPFNANTGAYISDGHGKVVAENLGATFTVNNLKPGNYWVVGVNGAGGYEQQPMHREVKAGRNVHAKIVLKKKDSVSPAYTMLYPQDQLGNYFSAHAVIKDKDGNVVFEGSVPGDSLIVLNPAEGPHIYTVFDAEDKWVGGGINSIPGSVTFRDVVFNYEKTIVTVIDTVNVTNTDTLYVDVPVPVDGKMLFEGGLLVYSSKVLPFEFEVESDLGTRRLFAWISYTPNQSHPEDSELVIYKDGVEVLRKKIWDNNTHDGEHDREYPLARWAGDIELPAGNYTGEFISISRGSKILTHLVAL